jgi:hypothetical protein
MSPAPGNRAESVHEGCRTHLRREIVSTESPVLSSGVGRIQTSALPGVAASGLSLLLPRVSSSSTGVRAVPLSSYSVMSERGLHS